MTVAKAGAGVPTWTERAGGQHRCRQPGIRARLEHHVKDGVKFDTAEPDVPTYCFLYMIFLVPPAHVPTTFSSFT